MTNETIRRPQGVVFIERIYQEQALREQFLDDNGLLKLLKPGASEAYQRHVERFWSCCWYRSIYAVGNPVVHQRFWGSGGRIQPTGGVRNFIMENGLVGLVAQYHKGYRSSGNIKIIHRYLPREVGELLVYYLWLVLPLWEKI